jgi:hypothetical protein
MTFELSEHFVAGHFLSPSPDPSCASFECMIPGQDSLQISNPGRFSFSATALPEPTSYILLVAGLTVIGAAVRRSRQRNSCH